MTDCLPYYLHEHGNFTQLMQNTSTQNPTGEMNKIYFDVLQQVPFEDSGQLD